MAISSMTGFARVDGQGADCTWIWEMRSVNGKGLDVRFRLPSFLSSLEDDLRSLTRSKFKRGNMQVSLQLDRETSQMSDVAVNLDLVRDLCTQMQPLVKEGLLGHPTAGDFLGVRGVVETKIPSLSLDDLQKPLIVGFAQLVDDLSVTRLEEGKATSKVLVRAIERMDTLVEIARNNPASSLQALQDRMMEQIAKLGETVPQERLAQEVAILAIKADINEELDRLSGHLEVARDLLLASEPIGRKLEFLTQELNREANTLCSKSSNQQLTELGLELKTLVDQIREQAANVE